MPDSDEFLNPLEKVGSSLLNGSLLHQRFVCVLDIKNDELPYQRFKMMLLLRSCCGLLCFLKLKSSDNECARARIIKFYRGAFLLNTLVLLLGQLTLDFSERNFYYRLSVPKHNTLT
jgi:hypothetical protein